MNISMNSAIVEPYIVSMVVFCGDVGNAVVLARYAWPARMLRQRANDGSLSCKAVGVDAVCEQASMPKACQKKFQIVALFKIEGRNARDSRCWTNSFLSSNLVEIHSLFYDHNLARNIAGHFTPVAKAWWTCIETSGRRKSSQLRNGVQGRGQDDL